MSCVSHLPSLALFAGLLAGFPLLGVGLPLAFVRWREPLRVIEARLAAVLATSTVLLAVALPELHARFAALMEGIDLHFAAWTRAAWTAGEAVRVGRIAVLLAGAGLAFAIARARPSLHLRIAARAAIAALHGTWALSVGGYAWGICELARLHL